MTGKSIWTVGTYAISALIRFSSNIFLSRLLGPEILGIVVVAQAVRSGAELLSDLGLEQNVVHSPHGKDERFLNTIWTMQIIRGAAISILCLCLAGVIAQFYRVGTAILLAMAAAPLLASLASTSIFSLSKDMKVKDRNLFELSSEIVGFILVVTLTFLLPTVWAPIIGIILSVAARSAISYVLPHPRHRLTLDRSHAVAIIHFSKWIMLSSLALYAAIYVDRLFLGRAAGLSALGIYGLARAISDLPQAVAGRIAFQIFFPFVANRPNGLDAAERKDLSVTRRNFLLLVAVGISTVMAWSDFAVHLLYDPRFADAGWMLFLLLIGSWMGVLSSLNEATIFGSGKPRNVWAANLVRVGVMAAVLPAGYGIWGLTGAVLALPISESVRYVILIIAQRKADIRFVAQDVTVSLGLAVLLGGWLAIREVAGFGVPWALIP